MFSKSNKNSKANIEEELEKVYSKMLLELPTGMSYEQAHKEVKKAIKLCKEQAKKEGTDKLPENYGDLLIKYFKLGKPNAIKIVDKAIKEGATVEDIREFWNLNDLQRRMVFWSENFHRTAVALSLWKTGISKDEKEKIATKIRKKFPKYGNPENTKVTTGDDRPLPQELRGRVDRWRIKIINEWGAEKIQEKIKKYSSFNALIRDEIRKNNL